MVPADVARTVVVDCASTAEFTADAVGLVAERLDLRFNRITLVNATMELTEAFTEQSVESAVRARHDQFFAEQHPQTLVIEVREEERRRQRPVLRAGERDEGREQRG